MFVLFSEHEADFALVEVGLGGRFDATNVIPSPRVCAIAPVALDHQAYLGNTIEKIAFEKAGIIKRKVPVAVGRQQDGARDVIEEVASKNGSPIVIAGQDFDAYRDATGFAYQDEDGLLDLPLPKLAGEHQLDNASLAIAAIRLAGIEVSPEAFAKGMQSVTWPGRLEKLPEGKITKQLSANADIWIDGGHNPSAGEAIAAELLRQNAGTDRKTLLICGMINTKEPFGYFKPFEELNAEVYTIPVAMSEAGIPPADLAEIAQSAGLKTQSFSSLNDAVKAAGDCLNDTPNMRILFCGSLYMVGEVLAINETPPQ